MRTFISRLLLISIPFLFSACASYELYQLPPSRLNNIQADNLSYYLIDAAHPFTRVWYMSDYEASETEISCYLTMLDTAEALEISKHRSSRLNRANKNNVLFYADPKFAVNIQDKSQIQIQLDQLEKIEVFEIDYIKTYGRPLLLVVGVLGIFYLISGG